MTVYLVTGRRAYRSHQPGEQFEAVLRPGIEMRAIERGNITVIEDSVPTIQPGYTFPTGWHLKRGGT